MNPVTALLEKIKGLDWSVEEEGDKDYRISKFSPAGQDFSIVVEVDGDDAETLITNIKEEYDNFDVSTETYLWLDSSGHGVNGAPHEMKDVLADMEACKQMIVELHNQLKEETQ